MLITGSAGGNTFRFSALTKELRNQGMEKDVTIYNLDARFDAVIDLSRQVGGVDGANLINDMNIYGYAAAGQQDWRTGATEGDLVTLCNKEYAAHTTLPQEDLPEPAPPAFARDPYGTVAADLRDVPHTRARALQRGPRPHTGGRDQGVRGAPLHRQHRGQGVTGAPRRHRSSTTRRRRCEYTHVLVKPEYPCAHPSLPPDPANYRICLIPQPGYDKGGKAVKRAVLRRQELAALTAEEHRTGEVVPRRELARGTVEADASLLDEDDAVGDGGGDVQ